MKNALNGFRFVALLLTIAGCATQVEDAADAEDEMIRDHIEALGFARESVEINGDVVLVDGDLVFYRDPLLNGEYERTDFMSDDVIEKGYVEGSKITSARRGNIKLAFSTNQQVPNQRIKDAFIAAAGAWSAVPGSSIRISTSNTGSTVTVYMINTLDWTEFARCPNEEACAEAPLNGRPGTKIWIKSRAVDNGCRGWTDSTLANVTRHEIGHVLGFAHPKDPVATHVRTTKECTRDANTCLYDEDKRGYTTVMGAANYTAACQASPARLTQDDYKTCAAYYPAP